MDKKGIFRGLTIAVILSICVIIFTVIYFWPGPHIKNDYYSYVGKTQEDIRAAYGEPENAKDDETNPQSLRMVYDSGLGVTFVMDGGIFDDAIYCSGLMGSIGTLTTCKDSKEYTTEDIEEYFKITHLYTEPDDDHITGKTDDNLWYTFYKNSEGKITTDCQMTYTDTNVVVK